MFIVRTENSHRFTTGILTQQETRDEEEGNTLWKKMASKIRLKMETNNYIYPLFINVSFIVIIDIVT